MVAQKKKRTPDRLRQVGEMEEAGPDEVERQILLNQSSKRGEARTERWVGGLQCLRVSQFQVMQCRILRTGCYIEVVVENFENKKSRKYQARVLGWGWGDCRI